MKIRSAIALLPLIVLASCLPLLAVEPVPAAPPAECGFALSTSTLAETPQGADLARLLIGPPPLSNVSPDACCLECGPGVICTAFTFCCPLTGQCC